MAEQKDFFISYNKADRFWADGLRDWLLKAGQTVIMQNPDFEPGSNFVIEMHEGLRGAKRMIGVLSPNYLASRFCSSEWAAKFAEDPTGSKRLLVFVKIWECHLDGLLSQMVHIDLTSLSVQAAEEKFLAEMAKISDTVRKSKPKRVSLKNIEMTNTEPKSGTTISQHSAGSHATNIGIQNFIEPKVTVRNEIKPGPEHITPAQRTEINDRLKELGEREAMVAVKKKFPDGPQTPEHEIEAKEITSRCFRFLRADFNRQVNDGQPYHLLPKENFENALSWIAQRKAIKRSSLRRADNELWRRDYERIIWGGMRRKNWQKQDVYDFALEQRIVDEPITSLKELKEQKLTALANAMKSKRAKAK